tara:strand:+ start:58439 stop:59494 length:1056 start_codon:yes stop_codon:yes gene_type:complete
MVYKFEGKLIKFDTKKNLLLDVVLEFFGANSLTDIFKKFNNSEIYSKLYQLEKTKKFSDIYKNLVKTMENELGTKEFYFQKIPSFRVHRINSSSVLYHNDIMYGHGEEVVNVWIPLLNTNKMNSLYLSDINQSIKVLKEFKNKKMSLIEANKLFQSVSNPCLVNYGEMLIFNTLIIHGTEVNSSNEDRISLDFRILPHGSNPSTKLLDDFYFNNKYEVNKIKNTFTACLYYLNKKNPIMENCSHSIQRQIMDMYSSENSFNSSGLEETEIHGVNHYPTICHYIEEVKIKNILMASLLCLPSDKTLRKHILMLAKKNDVILHFCLENKHSSNISAETLDSYYESILNSSMVQ